MIKDHKKLIAELWKQHDSLVQNINVDMNKVKVGDIFYYIDTSKLYQLDFNLNKIILPFKVENIFVEIRDGKKTMVKLQDNKAGWFNIYGQNKSRDFDGTHILFPDKKSARDIAKIKNKVWALDTHELKASTLKAREEGLKNLKETITKIDRIIAKVLK